MYNSCFNMTHAANVWDITLHFTLSRRLLKLKLEQIWI